MDGKSWQKEQFSRAYIHAMAAHEGYTLGDWNYDGDGVDVSLKRGGQQLDVQLKCTRKLRRTSEGYSFALDIKTYEKLRDINRSVPGYLFVMTVPQDLSEWLEIVADRNLILNSAAYYSQIQDSPAVDTTTTTAITIPFRNRIDSQALHEMFQHAFRHARGIRTNGLSL